MNRSDNLALLKQRQDPAEGLLDWNARKLAIIIYCMLRDHSPYRNLPAATYDQRHRTRVLHGLRKRAQSLGFDLVQLDTGLVLE